MKYKYLPSCQNSLSSFIEYATSVFNLAENLNFLPINNQVLDHFTVLRE